MGMSASQARYLALTARMNDIEYQGQQINQQRTTLSNQINELYNSLLDIDVPTPPSTKDYTKLVYSGNYNSSKFSIGTVTPSTEQGTYNIDLSYTNTGHYWAKGDTVTVKRGKTFYQVQDNWSKDLTNLVNTTRRQFVSSGETLNSFTVDLKQTDNPIGKGEDKNDDVYLKMTGAQYKALGSVYKNEASMVYSINNPDAEASNYILNRLDEDDKTDSASGLSLDDDTTYVVCLNKSSFAGECDVAPSGTQFPTDSLRYLLEQGPTMYTITDTNDNLKTDGTLNAYMDSDDVTEDLINEVLNSDYMVSSTDGTGAHTPRVTDFDIKDGKLVVKSGLQLGLKTTEKAADTSKSNVFTYGSDDDTKVGRDGNYDLHMNISEFLTDEYLETDEGKAYLDGLKNAFPTLWVECGKDVDEFLKNFAYYMTTKESSANNVYHAVLRSDLTGNCLSVPSYEYSPNGTYKSVQSEEGCKLEFGNDGRITAIGIPTKDGWSWVNVTMTEETDTDAYEEAFNQYEYDKYKYDKKQQEINAKTSIIQQEDKNLELKLTRLDNERNAVNTELEAVKKVVSDNIEKTFKTFSG